MGHSSYDINQLEQLSIQQDPDFTHAPLGWSRAGAARAAEQEGLRLSEAHWDVVRALQEYYARHEDDEGVNMRALHDALDERFHHQGGLRRLYMLFPGGPVAQGCRIAGLKAPTQSVDRSFGSVA